MVAGSGREFSGLASLIMVAATACANRPVRLVVVNTSVAETVSLLGDTLYAPRFDPATGPERVRKVTEARELLSRDVTDLESRLRLARATTEMGRFREAIALYNGIAEIHFRDPRVYRERGEVLLRLRHLDHAIADFHRAGLLLIGRNVILEAESSTEGRASGAAAAQFPLSTVQFRTNYFLGISHYLKGAYAAAYPALAEAARVAQTTDDVARAMLWLFLAARRIGDGGEGGNVLGLVKPDWAEQSEVAELILLLAFKGLVPTDSIRAWALARRDEESALYSYGVAYSLMLRPERRVDSELWLERAHSGGNWAALPYLAAEADLARLRGVNTVIR